MKYEYITFRKQLPRGKWADDPETPVRAFNSKKAALDTFIDRHSKIQRMGRYGNYGYESVTNIRKGGDNKGTNSFEYFFYYTFSWGKSRERFCEAIAPLVRK